MRENGETHILSFVAPFLLPLLCLYGVFGSARSFVNIGDEMSPGFFRGQGALQANPSWAPLEIAIPFKFESEFGFGYK